MQETIIWPQPFLIQVNSAILFFSEKNEVIALVKQKSK